MIVSLEQAQRTLPELIASLQPGDEAMITQENRPIAKLAPEGKPQRKPRQPGSCKGMLTIVSDDDEHLKDFAEYMP